MSSGPTPHDFLLYLRTRAPALARRLDGLSGMERRKGLLILKAPEGSWTFGEITSCRPELDREVEHFFGPGWRFELHASRPDPQALPLPALTSKAWNHLAFLVAVPAGWVGLSVPKPLYREEWLPRWQAAGCPEGWLPPLLEQAHLSRFIGPGSSGGDVRLLPAMLDELARLARASSSYVHLITPFPGDDVAEQWEARVYATKEWGTPETPGPILHKYVGRLHYVGPGQELLGFRVARDLEAG